MNVVRVVWRGQTFTITHLTRLDWQAGPVRRGDVLPAHAFKGLVPHHTVYALQDYDRDGYLHGDLDDIRRYMRTLQTSRPDLGSEVPYSGVGFTGPNPTSAVICDGRGPNRSGAHTAGLNHERYALAYAGNTDHDPIPDSIIAAFRYWASLYLGHATLPTIGHRQAPPYWHNGQNLNATACPGRNLMARLPDLQPPFPPMIAPQEDDVALTEAQEKALAAIPGIANQLAKVQSDGARTLNQLLGRPSSVDDDPRPIRTAIGEISKIVKAIEVGDTRHLADALVEELGPDLAADVADELARRLKG